MITSSDGFFQVIQFLIHFICFDGLLWYIMHRSYESLCALSGSPLLTQLVPAVGTMAFAAWGLGPLIRVARAIFLRVQNVILLTCFAFWEVIPDNYLTF